MKNLPFHIIAIIVNIILMSLVTRLCVFMIEYLYQDIYFTKKGNYLIHLYTFSVCFLSWSSTILIYFYKNYHKHYLFFIILLLGYATFTYFLSNKQEHPVDFIQEIYPYTIIISFLIHYSQIMIGKKLLPKLYQTNSYL